MPYYGTKSHPLFGHNESSGTDNLRGTFFGALPEDAHLYSMGFYAGYYDSGDPATAKGGLYNASRELLRESEAATLDNRFIENNDGALIDSLDFDETVIGDAGDRYVLAILGYNGAFSHGQDNTPAFMYRSNRGGTTLPDPLSSAGDPQTRITIWVNYEANVKPDKPSDLTPADGGTTTDTTPLYEGDFTDDNEVMPNGLTSDYLTAYQIQVRSVSSDGATTGTLVWDSGVKVASETERDNARFSRSHGGSALTAGSRYQMRARVQDRHGAWSDWSHGQFVSEAWQDFLVTGAGIITLDGTPTGRTTDTTPDFQGRYHHVLGTAATHVKIQLWSGNTFLKETTEIAKAISSSASPGTLFTITAAESAFGTLNDGTNYKYRIAAKSGGVYSEYSAFRTFKTNTKPTTPTNLRPAGGATSTLPLITFQSTDPDGDALTAEVRIKSDAGALLFTRAATYDAALYNGLGGWKYQTTSTDFATFAVYRFDARSSDGSLTSDYSGEQNVTYAAGPSITITAPTEAEVITTDTPLITWTVTGQVKRRVYIYDATTNALLHDSGEATTATASYSMPADILRNGGTYYVIVQVTNSAPLTGTSAQRNFSLVYTALPVVSGFYATPDYAEQDVEPSVMLLGWDAITVASGDYLRTTIYRGDAGSTLASAMKVYETTNQGATSWTDTIPKSGVGQTYWMTYEVQESALDILTAEAAEVTGLIEIQATVISDIRSGMTDRVFLWSTQERQEETQRDQTEIQTWDGGAPWLFEGPVEYKTMQVEAFVYQTAGATVEEQLAGLRYLEGSRLDGSRVLSCYRDDRSRKFFGRVRGVRIKDVEFKRARVSFLFTELSHDEEWSDE
jgi:hypothetical protein